MESNRRIDRYKGYASGLKHKFAEFERQSEEYYGSLLEKFKTRATREFQKKEQELAALEVARTGHLDKIGKIKNKLIERQVRGAKEIMSDDDMDSDPEEAELEEADTHGKIILTTMGKEVNLAELKLAKAEREDARNVVLEWIDQFEK